MFFWGSAAVFVRTLALSLSPENSLALRYVILVFINGAGLAMLGTWRIRREHWKAFLIAGLFGMGGYNWFVNAGFALVPAGVGTIISSVQPIMIAVLAWAVLGERLSSYIWLGLLIATAGGIVLFWNDITSLAGSAVSVPGIIYLLISCAGWSIYTIAVKPLVMIYDTYTITAVTMLIASPALILGSSEPLHLLALRLDLRQWLEIFYLIIFSGILGTMLWNYGARRISSAATGTFLYLIPVIAVMCGWLILSEPVTMNIVLGGAIMLAGVATAQFGPAMQKMVFMATGQKPKLPS